MRDWSLGPGDPLCLTLGADFRLSRPDYVNDHIWELEIGSGEPAALCVRTTFGLRSRGLRLFWRFDEGGAIRTNPSEFHTPPRLRRFHPNFLLLEFSPFEGLDVSAEYWVPESRALAGRITLHNRSSRARQLNLELCGVLTPIDGKSLKRTQQQMVNVLEGQTGGLAVLIFMTGGPRRGPGPQPSLALNLDFEPGARRQFTWVQAATESSIASFELARSQAARPWDAERARIELTNAAETLDIHTGDPDWDAALAFSQKAAFGLFYPATEHLPNPSYVETRRTDHGYSPKGDGLDYPPAWSGQTTLETYYMTSLLPAAPVLIKGLIENHLSTQAQDGAIDNKPGINGQRGKFQATPLLAALAWKHYQLTQDAAFASRAFPKLLASFLNWFAPAHDGNGDGLPEWDHVLQTGFEDNPLFDVWHPWSQGADISSVHDPALEALLYREAASLIRMAEKLGLTSELGALHARAAALRGSVDSAWNARNALYAYRDIGSNDRPLARLIGKHKGSGDMRLRAAFDSPVRILVEVQSRNALLARPEIEIGESAGDKGQMEIIDGQKFQWRSGGLVATSEKLFSRVRRVSIRGVDEKDKVIIKTVDLNGEAIPLFAPLWAHIPETQQAQALLAGSLMNPERFHRPFGAPALPSTPDPRAEAVAMAVHLPWNQLIGEGLLSYGFREECADLVTRLMKAVIQNLKQAHAFYQRYHAATGSGLGERGSLNGMAPVGLFMETLGVRILSDEEVRLEGRNPFAWPVTIQYKGLKVVRGLKQTEITFGNRRALLVTDSEPMVVSVNE